MAESTRTRPIHAAAGALLRTAAACALLLITGIAGAEEQTSERAEALAAEVLDAAGYAELVDQMPAQMMAGMRSNAAPTAEAEQFNDLVERRMRAAHDAEALFASAASSLASQLDEEALQSLASWYRSELGARITAAETAAGDPAVMEDMAATAPALMRDAERMVIAQRILDAASVTDVVMAMQEEAAAATFLVVARNAPREAKPDLERFRKQLEEQAPMMRIQISQMMLVSTLYSQREIETEGMVAYAEFLERPESQVLIGVVNEGVRETSRGLLQAIVDVIEEAVRKQEKNAA